MVRYRVSTPAGITAELEKEVALVTEAIGTDAFDYTPPRPEVVNELFAKNEWSQTDVANMVNVNVSTVRRWTTSEKYDQYVKIPFVYWTLLLIIGGYISDAEILAA